MSSLLEFLPDACHSMNNDYFSKVIDNIPSKFPVKIRF